MHSCETGVRLGLESSDESVAHGDAARSLTRSTMWGDNCKETTPLVAGCGEGSSAIKDDFMRPVDREREAALEDGRGAHGTVIPSVHLRVRMLLMTEARRTEELGEGSAFR